MFREYKTNITLCYKKMNKICHFLENEISKKENAYT